MTEQTTCAEPPCRPGWYPDGTGRFCWWDGTAWSTVAAPAVAGTPDRAVGWAIGAHLSALTALMGLPVVGPLAIRAGRRDDALVRAHATEALNFNISVAMYGAVLFAVMVLTGLIGSPLAFGAFFLTFPLLAGGMVAWLTLTFVAAVRAASGEPYRYPLTMRIFR